VDILVTVPDVPPAAGPDRALDPAPGTVAGEEEDVADDTGDADGGVGDVEQPAESPSTAPVSAAAAISAPLRGGAAAWNGMVIAPNSSCLAGEAGVIPTSSPRC
jgi:hypothetical protein